MEIASRPNSLRQIAKLNPIGVSSLAHHKTIIWLRTSSCSSARISCHSRCHFVLNRVQTASITLGSCRSLPPHSQSCFKHASVYALRLSACCETIWICRFPFFSRDLQMATSQIIPMSCPEIAEIERRTGSLHTCVGHHGISQLPRSHSHYCANLFSASKVQSTCIMVRVTTS